MTAFPPEPPLDDAAAERFVHDGGGQHPPLTHPPESPADSPGQSWPSSAACSASSCPQQGTAEHHLSKYHPGFQPQMNQTTITHVYPFEN